MNLKHFEQTGERFIPTQSNPTEVIVNLDRYSYALTYCKDKVVMDLGCGSGLGTYLYSLVAKQVIAIDYNENAFEYLNQFPFENGKISMVKMDLEKELPSNYEVDTVVALEVLEHLENPEKLLEELKTTRLVFSLPTASMSVSDRHKFNIRNGAEGVEDVRKLIEKSYVIDELKIQADLWIQGVAHKRKLWL